MNRLVPSEFSSSLQDNRVRPYTVGLKAHEQSLATIVLYTKDEHMSLLGKTNDEADKNYLSDLSKNIESLTSEALTVGKVGVPQANGTIPILTLDEKNDYYGLFNNFSLLNVNEVSGQIMKLHQHFGGEWNVFMFGSQPQMFDFSGLFIDSEEYPYYQEFMVAYHKYLAGRRCIENKMQMKLVYDGKVVDGYMVNISTSSSAETPLLKQFRFTVLVKSESWLRINRVPILTRSNGAITYKDGYNVMSNLARIGPLTSQMSDESQLVDEDDSVWTRA